MASSNLDEFIKYFEPVSKGTLLNTNVVGTADMLSGSVNPTHTPCMVRVCVCLDQSHEFWLTRHCDGVATVVTEKLNSGGALTARCTYAFDIPLQENEQVNFQQNNAGTVIYLSATEYHPFW